MRVRIHNYANIPIFIYGCNHKLLLAQEIFGKSIRNSKNIKIATKCCLLLRDHKN
jgi:hypothetical protein